jgi:sulfonate transport system substrate-binding protein
VADQNQQLETLFSASGVENSLGFKVNWEELDGQPEVLQALRAGADVASASEVGAIFATAQGEPVKVIGAVRNNTSYPYVFVTANKDITNISQLKGKSIAWVQGTSYSLFTIRALAAGGLTTKDVTLVNLTFTTLSNAIRTGQVAAGALVEPTATTYLSEFGSAGLHELTQAHNLCTGLYATIYATQKALDNPAEAAALGKFSAAFIKAEAWINANPTAWATDYLVKIEKVSPANAAVIIQKQGASTVPTLASLVSEYQGFVTELLAADQIPSTLSASSLIDTNFDPIEQTAEAAS